MSNKNASFTGAGAVAVAVTFSSVTSGFAGSAAEGLADPIVVPEPYITPQGTIGCSHNGVLEQHVINRNRIVNTKDASALGGTAVAININGHHAAGIKSSKQDTDIELAIENRNQQGKPEGFNFPGLIDQFVSVTFATPHQAAYVFGLASSEKKNLSDKSSVFSGKVASETLFVTASAGNQTAIVQIAYNECIPKEEHDKQQLKNPGYYPEGGCGCKSERETPGKGTEGGNGFRGDARDYIEGPDLIQTVDGSLYKTAPEPNGLG